LLKAVNAWEELIAARLLEFFDWHTLWHRSLWNPGLVMMLKEVLEASEAAQNNILSEDALNLCASSAIRVAALDPGVGNRKLLKALQEALHPRLRYNGLDYAALAELANTLERDYLVNWAAYLASEDIAPNPERAARGIAAHLLDLGFSSDYLHRWWTFQTRYDRGQLSLADIVTRAEELTKAGNRTFEVLIAFDEITPERFGRPNGWIEADAVTVWLKAHNFSTINIRQLGGVVLQIEARDGGAAADAAFEAFQGLAARAVIATGRELRQLRRVWVSGQREPYQVQDRNRGVNVRALVRQDVVYRRSINKDGVDAAFEMLAPLQRGSSAEAIAAGWAAIEALLSEPNDRGGAADRLAALVACSFPRAELTQLSYNIEKVDPLMARALAGVADNRGRCEIVARSLLEGEAIASSGVADEAAIERARRILNKPAEALQDVQTHVSLAFRRVYRQRNLVLHGGKTDAVALRTCLRTAAPLVGAGMDRLAHGYYVQHVLPLVTAARARIALTLTGPHNAIGVIDLLP
jgi:hypothetical protein